VVQERIFTPLGMKHSGYDVAATLIHRRHQRLQHAVAAGPRESIGEVVSSALKASKPDAYDFDNEQALNMAGYSALQKGRSAEAIELFKLNVEMFPKSGNPYDSHGEAYLAVGNKELGSRTTSARLSSTRRTRARRRASPASRSP
jgi:CubicO group peptidase (beta-lactamase class C family)